MVKNWSCSFKNKNILFILLVLLSLIITAYSVVGDFSQFSQCPGFSSQSTCQAGNCYWKSDNDGHSWCQVLDCFAGDNNKGLCFAMNKSVNGTVANGTNQGQQYNTTITCSWEVHGTGLCDPVDGETLGNDCDDFDNDEDGCY